MLKLAIDIDKWNGSIHSKHKHEVSPKFEPNWAYNFLSKNEVLLLLLLIKKTKRKEVYLQLLELQKKEELVKQFECNAKGQVVFKWNSASEKMMFIMKWS